MINRRNGISRERKHEPGGLVLAAIVLWIATLTAIYLLLGTPPEWVAAMIQTWPALSDLREALLSLFQSDHIF